MQFQTFLRLYIPGDRFHSCTYPICKLFLKNERTFHGAKKSNDFYNEDQNHTNIFLLESIDDTYYLLQSLLRGHCPDVHRGQ